MPTLDFWYEFASTYSYLSAMRIREAADEAGVEIRWKPFLLGPIFKANGWDTSPFNLFPAKGRYMVQDVSRIAAARGIPFAMPRPFPQNSLYAARIAVIASAEGWAEPFTMAIFRAAFADAKKIDDPAVLAESIRAAGRDPQALLPRISEEGIKNLLKAFTAQAQALGVFGAPSFVTSEGELFWGDDRLGAALDQAKREAEKQEEARKAQEERAKERAAREAELAKQEAEARESEPAAALPPTGSESPAQPDTEAGPEAKPGANGDAPAQPNGPPNDPPNGPGNGQTAAPDTSQPSEPDKPAEQAGEKTPPQ